jgi:hypothetical protein
MRFLNLYQKEAHMLKICKTFLLSVLARWKESDLCKIIAKKYQVSEETVFLFGATQGELTFIELTDEAPLVYSRKGTLLSPHYKLSFKETIRGLFDLKKSVKTQKNW